MCKKAPPPTPAPYVGAPIETVKSTGFHVVEYHAPTAGYSNVAIAVAAAIVFCAYKCTKKCTACFPSTVAPPAPVPMPPSFELQPMAHYCAAPPTRFSPNTARAILEARTRSRSSRFSDYPPPRPAAGSDGDDNDPRPGPSGAATGSSIEERYQRLVDGLERGLLADR